MLGKEKKPKVVNIVITKLMLPGGISIAKTIAINVIKYIFGYPLIISTKNKYKNGETLNKHKSNYLYLWKFNIKRNAKCSVIND